MKKSTLQVFQSGEATMFQVFQRMEKPNIGMLGGERFLVRRSTDFKFLVGQSTLLTPNIIHLR